MFKRLLCLLCVVVFVCGVVSVCLCVVGFCVYGALCLFVCWVYRLLLWRFWFFCELVLTICLWNVSRGRDGVWGE